MNYNYAQQCGRISQQNAEQKPEKWNKLGTGNKQSMISLVCGVYKEKLIVTESRMAGGRGRLGDVG